ncbi:glycoside hydrolase family 3 protein [Uniformispora flossi]|uniref:glycoside hydrolase family 3 protein n=1 Tax=Uniformispora flossi TaxID=3390723 RepID=UPI003C2F77C8
MSSDSTPVVDPTYLDASLPVDERIANLLGQMTLEEKAGLFFHTVAVPGQDGAVVEDDPVFGMTSVTELIAAGLNHFNLLGSAPDARAMAAWHNTVQRAAAETRLGIPVTISTDPRHAFSDNPAAAMMAGPFSQWPEPLGLAAIGDPDTVERFADIARQEYTAVGIRVALHPQIDLATEPRWSRQNHCFGEDADLTSRLGAAYVRGFQGGALGTESVSAMAKHFPGGGPQKDGEDPHFAHGREQVYPGDNFDYHLKPFEAAFEAGVSQIMPYYGMPVGTEYEEVGFSFNKSVVTRLLRDRYGFDGIVCTDWGLITDREVFGQPFPARAWGVEHLNERERMLRLLDAGVDQFGGEQNVGMLVELVRSGTVDEQRLDISARRILREKFVLGLFDHPYVDEGRAERAVGSAEFRAAGAAAQRAAFTVLTNRQDAQGTPVLPLARGSRIHVRGIDPELAATYGTVVDDPASADVAIVRIAAPFEPRTDILESMFHSGSLDFPAEQLDELRTLARTVPTVLDIYLERPAVLTPLVDEAAAIVVDFGADDKAALDVLFGIAEPRGALPMDLPRSMDAVLASRSDVPFDTADPLFRFGHGLRLR